MSQKNSVENAKKMRSEVTTLSQFGIIGTYEDVAKKYEISKSTAYSYMKKLHEKMKEGKKVEIKNTLAKSTEIACEGIKTEITIAQIEHLEPETDELLDKADDCHLFYEKDLDEIENELREQDEFENEAIIAMTEDPNSPEVMIEAMWNVVESDLNLIRKLYIKRAEEDYKARRSKVMAC